MAPKLPTQERLRLIDRVINKGESVSKICQEAGISRVIFYRWLKRYKEEGRVSPKKPQGAHPARQIKEKLVKRIIALIRQHPAWSTHKISQHLPVGNHGVQNVLARLNLNTIKKRRGFVQKAKGLTEGQAFRLAKKKRIVPSLKKLSPQKKLEAIRQVVRENKPIAQVCREFHISRPAFYKWLKRYSKARVDKRLEALQDRRPKIARYYRQTPEKYEEAVLSLVAKHPEFGVQKLVRNLPQIAGKPIVGYHGIQRVLERNNLNTYVLRLAYSQAQVTPVTRLITTWQEAFAKLFVLPVKTRQAVVRFVSLAAFSCFLTVVGLGILGYFGHLFTRGPGVSRLGLFFATNALVVGSIFFIYSLKYYLTLALVLSFSRQSLEEGGGYAIGLNGHLQGNGRFNNHHLNGNGGLTGWLKRVFGLNGNGNGSQPEVKVNSRLNGQSLAAGGLQPSLDHIKLKRYPFVSIHLPFYNEKKVAKRIIKSCMTMEYPKNSQGRPNFEVIICDDSNDETSEIIKRYQEKLGKVKTYKGENGETVSVVEPKDKPTLKVIHRETREGFKGGALSYALKHLNSETEFVCVFDADFIPYPDTLEQFLKYFKATGGWEENQSFAVGKIQSMPYQTFRKVKISPEEGEILETQLEQLKDKSQIACVAGYQWHVLNKSENWITQGVRSEYAGSYVIERPGQEILGAVKLIHGSVYCIRADVLKHFGWGTSITEDFELTLRLYEQGFKVVYTPYIQAPSECVATIKRLIRQRMRWAEGHSFNIKKMFMRLMFGQRVKKAQEKRWHSSPLTLMEKLEVLYLSPYYLQAFFFLVGTFSWLISETVFKARLPFWTSLWGWSLVLTNFFALPLVNAVGLFLEEAEERDYLGLLSFVALSYLLVPFQAYAAVKGFLEKEEGPWFRTPKTGKITDVFTRGKFYRWISGILPRRRIIPAPVAASVPAFAYAYSPYVARATANNQFNNFTIRPKRLRWVSKAVLSILLIISSTILSLTRGVPEILATNPTDLFFLRDGDDASTKITTTVSWQYKVLADGTDSTSTQVQYKNLTGAFHYQPGTLTVYSSAETPGSATGHGWIWDTPFGDNGSIASQTWTFYVNESDNCSGATSAGYLRFIVYKVTVSGGAISGSTALYDSGTAFSSTDILNGGVNDTSFTSATIGPFSFAANDYLYVDYWLVVTSRTPGETCTSTFRTGPTYTNPKVDMPAITIPEKVIFFLAAAPFIPMVVMWMRKRRNRKYELGIMNYE